MNDGEFIDFINDKNNKRIDIAKVYAVFIKEYPFNSNLEKNVWTKINRAIINRWSKSGLMWIKKESWERLKYKEE